MPVLLGTAILLIGGFFLLNQSSEPQATPNPTPSPAPTPTPQPVAEIPDDWLTYRNDEFGFEVKYPADWAVNESGTRFYDVAKDNEVSALIQKCEETGYILSECDTPYFPDYSFTISLEKNSQNLELTEFYIKQIDPYPQNEPRRSRAGSFDAIWDYDMTKRGTDYVFFLSSSKQFGVLLRNEIGDFDLFNQFLSSFQFIEKS